jgi:hypothetical protein
VFVFVGLLVHGRALADIAALRDARPGSAGCPMAAAAGRQESPYVAASIEAACIGACRFADAASNVRPWPAVPCEYDLKLTLRGRSSHVNVSSSRGSWALRASSGWANGGDIGSDGISTRRVAHLHATRGIEAAGPRLISAIPARVTNAANHIFGPQSLARHKLGDVLSAYKGDATAAFYSLENAAQALANRGAIQGVFQTTVEVAGQGVTVRGAVVDGVVRIDTAFVP